MPLLPGAGVQRARQDGGGLRRVKDHLSYLPHSGSVLAQLDDEVAGYETSKGSLKFAVDKPLPKRLVKKLITTRMRELELE